MTLFHTNGRPLTKRETKAWYKRIKRQSDIESGREEAATLKRLPRESFLELPDPSERTDAHAAAALASLISRGMKSQSSRQVARDVQLLRDLASKALEAKARHKAIKAADLIIREYIRSARMVFAHGQMIVIWAGPFNYSGFAPLSGAELEWRKDDEPEPERCTLAEHCELFATWLAKRRVGKRVKRSVVSADAKAALAALKRLHVALAKKKPHQAQVDAFRASLAHYDVRIVDRIDDYRKAKCYLALDCLPTEIGDTDTFWLDWTVLSPGGSPAQRSEKRGLEKHWAAVRTREQRKNSALKTAMSVH